MPVILCPECKGKLKLPDNVEARKVKCPTCNAIFMSNEAKSDGDPPSSVKTSSSKPKPLGKNRTGSVSSALGNFEKVGGSKKKEEVVEDFEIIDEDEPAPRSRSRSRDDDDDTSEERRPREKERERRRSRDDEDDEDRPRNRRSRRDEEDEDDDDRPRNRRSRRDERDDDDDDDRPRNRRSRRDDDYDDDRPSRRDRVIDDGPKQSMNFDGVRIALLMHAIASWCMAGALGCMTIFFIAIWARINAVFLSQIAGIVSIGFIVVSGVAYGFCLAGPKKNGMLGLSIASACIVGVRLIMVIVLLAQSGGLGSGLPGMTTTVLGLITMVLPVFGMYLYGLFNGAGFSFELFIMVGVEIAQLIVFTLYLQAAAKTSRDRGGEAEASNFVMFWSVGSGVIAFSGLAVILLIRAVGSVTFAEVMMPIFSITTVGSLGALYAWHGFVVQSVQEGLDESGERSAKKKKKRR